MVHFGSVWLAHSPSAIHYKEEWVTLRLTGTLRVKIINLKGRKLGVWAKAQCIGYIRHNTYPLGQSLCMGGITLRITSNPSRVKERIGESRWIMHGYPMEIVAKNELINWNPSLIHSAVIKEKHDGDGLQCTSMDSGLIFLCHQRAPRELLVRN